jgi:hypothetical protein
VWKPLWCRDEGATRHRGQGQIAQLDVFVTVQVDATANPAKVSRLRFDADDFPLLARDFSGQERKIAFVASNIYKGLA